MARPPARALRDFLADREAARLATAHPEVLRRRVHARAL
jgi:hypothetical protein